MRKEKPIAAPPWRRRSRALSPDYDVKKIAILDAAARLFCTQGYKGVSLNELAAALNVTKPTIYYYFPSKDEILRAIKIHANESVVRMLVEVRASERRGIDQLAEVLRRYVKILASDYGRVVALVHDQVLTKKSSAIIRNQTAEVDSHIFAIYDQAEAEGDITPVERHVMHYTLFGALNWTPNWYDPQGKISVDKLAEMQVALLLDGLRKRGKTGPRSS